MWRRRREEDPVLITDAELSLDDEQRIRKRIYATLMVVHIVGFTIAGLLAHIWWLALAIVCVTGPLPWVAVVIANDRVSNRTAQRVRRQRPELEAPQHGSDPPEDEQQ